MGESIVVGTDGSETAGRAVDEAVRIGQALGAELHIVSAYEALVGAKVSGSPGEGKAVVPVADSIVDSTLAQAAAKARARAVKVETHAVRKDPVDALLTIANELDATTIVVGSRGMHGARRVLGSVPNKISHRASCNVLIVFTDHA
jgi:nucleotide-binding universal stress UspA family protein